MMNLKKVKYMLIMCGVSVVAYSTTAKAAELFLLPDTNSLLVLGEIVSSDARDIINYIENEGVDTLILRGPGGSFDTAMLIAEAVIENSTNTVVPENTLCASSCAIVFSAGHERSLGSGARLGFHTPFIMFEQPSDMQVYCESLEPSDQTTGSGFRPSGLDLLGYGANAQCLTATFQLGMQTVSDLNIVFDRDGISPLVMDAIISTPPSTMVWYHAQDARYLGLVNSP